MAFLMIPPFLSPKTERPWAERGGKKKKKKHGTWSESMRGPLGGAPRDQITVAFGTGEVTGQFVQDRTRTADGPPTAQIGEPGVRSVLKPQGSNPLL